MKKENLVEAADEIGIAHSGLTISELKRELSSFVDQADLEHIVALSSGTLYRLTQVKDVSGRGSMSSAEKICALLSADLSDEERKIVQMSTDELHKRAKEEGLSGLSQLRKHQLILKLCNYASGTNEDPDPENAEVWMRVYDGEDNFLGYCPEKSYPAAASTLFFKKTYSDAANSSITHQRAIEPIQASVPSQAVVRGKFVNRNETPPHKRDENPTKDLSEFPIAQ